MELFTKKEWKEMEEMMERAKQQKQVEIKKPVKKRTLSKTSCFVLGMMLSSLLLIVMTYSVNNYSEYLQKCDEMNGYTCNVFGK